MGSGFRQTKNPEPVTIIVFGEAHANQAAIDTANKRLDDFEDAYNKAAYLIAESISDSEILSVMSVLEDPVATWDKLKETFAVIFGQKWEQKPRTLHFFTSSISRPRQPVKLSKTLSHCREMC